MATVIIVGAGTGGIATAARLAQQGFHVKVVEQHGFIGGRCSIISEDGYRFDQGPSLLLMREVFEETFEDLGTSLNQEDIRLIKCEPNYRVWFPDMDIIEVSTDLTRLKEQIQHHEGPDGFPRFCAFLNEAGTHYNLSLAHMLRKNFPRLLSLLRWNVLKSLIFIHPWTSTYARAARYFYSGKMRRVWTFGSMYMGMSPYRAPATYSLLQYIETVDGIWYPEGGFQRVLRALADIGQRSGVEYILNSPVKSVLLDDRDRFAKGIVLEDGKELYADLVVINADLVYAYNELLPKTHRSHNLKKRPASCSSISFFWSFDEKLPPLRAHNIFLAEEYRESFDAIFEEHRIPDEPSFYVNIPSKIDSTAAPPGKDAVVVLVPVGHLTSEIGGQLEQEKWDILVSQTREIVLDTIEARTGLQGLRSKLVHETVETPLTWEKKYNLDRGAILGLSHSFFNVLSFRPKTKHPDIERLYFVGASTHPGTGVPVCLLGSKLVAQQIVEDWNMEIEQNPRMGLILTVVMALLALVVSVFWKQH
ncbi:hypothetical protein BDV37DRAFT_271828 [Aspergillus pseudonomiae]|uniref:Phytoene desaturase n=1 Tax=Aspergillus pseudonomiae TaxID=1506151 RepID=A0A5N7DCF1_9EURO|nr:uncharacterized protein BDV37DRAFT_271828 [Aspergillus pseudonomiae]KAE8403919.1 hypothetical protein BDV37DRAFT_271828 [Aspergillus pseudonomiae]